MSEKTPAEMIADDGPYAGLSAHGIAVTALERILGLDPGWMSWDEARAIASEAHGLAVAAAAGEPQPAPAHPFTTECDGFHPVGEQCNLPPEQPRPAPVLHQLSGLVAGWRQAVSELAERPTSSDETAEAEALGRVIRQVLAVIESATSDPEPQPAPELAAAMAETRGYREQLAAIRELCEKRLKIVGMVDGKGVARKVIAIIDKPQP